MRDEFTDAIIDELFGISMKDRTYISWTFRNSRDGIRTYEFTVMDK